jgi:NifB/MoaA-like Fe-S oxidoreductase
MRGLAAHCQWQQLRTPISVAMSRRRFVDGQDLLSARERIDGAFVLIPKQMLKSDEDIMLDGMKLDHVQKNSGLPLHAVGLWDLPQVLASVSH